MKKFLKRILLILLAVLVAIQAPFIYRRYKVGKLAEKVATLNAERTSLTDDRFTEYKGIIHAHTNLGGHSTGGFDELIAAANANDLDFVIMTEHWSDTIDTAALTLNGVYGKTLFVGGNEIDTADSGRFLMIPGSADAAGLRKIPTTAVIEKLHSENRLALVTYPEKFNSWNSDFDGIEVFNLHTNAKTMNPFIALFDVIWSFPAYPELMLASYFKRPDENLRKFDEIAANRNITLFAGTDAHSNIGFHLFGDDAGNKGLNFKFDDYATIFRLARQHVQIGKDRPITRENLIEALKSGRSFIGFDVLADTRGFTFTASSCEDNEGPMGSDIELCDDMGASTAYFSIESPLESRIVAFRNGEIFREAPNTRNLEFSSKDQPGTYRIEVYLDQLGPPFDKMPWIISNPIYVR
ncbi:MAG: hypothetical protein ACT4O9_08125 [Blastocatellia bacterium]